MGYVCAESLIDALPIPLQKVFITRDFKFGFRALHAKFGGLIFLLDFQMKDENFRNCRYVPNQREISDHSGSDITFAIVFICLPSFLCRLSTV
jgi:hypothetical protein